MADQQGNVQIKVDLTGYSQLIIKTIEEEKRNKPLNDDDGIISGNKIIKDRESGKVFKYYCEDCFKGFTHCGDYKKHLRSHTGERPYGCHECTKQFSRKGDLATHISMVHKKERPFLCEVCSKSFSQNSDLLKHSRIHSGEKPYACDFCTKKFARKDHLRKHFYTHTKSFTKNNIF